MARIPDVTDLGQRRVPRTAGGIVQDRSGQIIGQAIADTGETIMRAQDQRRDANTRLEMSKAKRDFLLAESEVSSELDQNPDWSSHSKTYSERMAKAREAAAAGISEGRAREEFMLDTDVSVARGLEGVKRRARDIEVQSGRRDALTDSEALLNGALNTSDERIRAEMLNALSARLDAVSDGDENNPGTGYFRNGEVQSIKTKLVGQYAEGRLDALPLRERVAMLENYEGTPAALMGAPERIQRLSIEKERLRVEDERLAREAKMEARIAAAEAEVALRDAESDAFAAKASGVDGAALPPRSLYIRAYGPEGAKRYEQSARRFSVYDAVSTVVTLPPAEAKEILDRYAPTSQEGAAGRAAAQAEAEKLYERLRKELVDDPATGIMERDAEIRALYEAGRGGDAAASAQYAQRVRAKADAMALPPKLLPKQDEAYYTALLTFDPENPRRRVEALQSLSAQWGRYFPQVIREIGPKLESDARIVANMTPENARKYDAVLAQGKKKIDDQLTDDQKDRIKGSVRDQLQPFMESIMHTPDSESRINEHVEATQLLAMSLVNRGAEPAAAAKQAADMVVNERYQYRGSIRVPKGFDVDAIDRGADRLRREIKPETLAVAPSRFGTVEESRLDLATLIQKEGEWVTYLDAEGREAGLELLVPIGGSMKPVITTDGKRMRRTWDELESGPAPSKVDLQSEYWINH